MEVLCLYYKCELPVHPRCMGPLTSTLVLLYYSNKGWPYIRYLKCSFHDKVLRAWFCTIQVNGSFYIDLNGSRSCPEESTTQHDEGHQNLFLSNFPRATGEITIKNVLGKSPAPKPAVRPLDSLCVVMDSCNPKCCGDQHSVYKLTNFIVTKTL